MGKLISESASKLCSIVLMGLFLVGCASQPAEQLSPAVEPVTVVPQLNVERAMDAVVHIAAYVENDMDMGYDDPYAEPQSWQGSGCFISNDGIILTAGHVVDGADRFEITLRDGTVLESTVSMRGDNLDVGFIKVDLPEGMTVETLAWDNDPVYLTEPVYIMGHPLGWMNNWTISKGILSNLGRDCEGFFGQFLMLQADAASYPGNSGGPVIDMEGEIVGVLVGGIGGEECLSYISPTPVVRQWADLFRLWLEVHNA